MFRPLCWLFAFAFAAHLSGQETANIRLIVTTDLHGYIYPYDYYTAKPAERGLAKAATLIAAARAENPDSLLVDCGDTIQGSALETVYQGFVRTGRAPKGVVTSGLTADPIVLAMNQLKFDAMAVGNHEFNYGLRNLNAARNASKFPWISANTQTVAGSTEKPFAPYIVKTIKGIKVGVVGITTPGVPAWEEPKNYKGYQFLPGKEAAEAAVKDLKAKHNPDIVIVAAHAGLEDTGDLRGENMVKQIATEVPGIDGIVFGHTHATVAGHWVGNVLVMQPRNWGISIGTMDFALSKSNGKWQVTDKKSKLIPVTKDTLADPAILAIAKPYHEAAEQYLTSPVAEAPVDMNAQLSRIQDTPLIDAIHQTQLHYADADVSFAASFNPRVTVRKGPVTVREIAALYVYDNTLYGIEGNGKMVREALENAARFFESCPDAACEHGPLINPKVVGFNFDMAQGVDYEIDLTKPAGQRIVNLKYKGAPLKDDQPLKIAVNNYRAGGSAGYTMFKGAKVYYRSPEEIRDLMIRYFAERKSLPAKPDGNWRVVPAAAAATLERDAIAETRRGENR
ncbi:5'-nucleotidase [Bryobacterales bacterium F-183]|nr:5'-nucleotidase [Bryobacterales bacterium F-183]